MINMIKSDAYRITKHVAFYIAAAIILLMIGISVYVVQPGAVGQMTVGDVNTAPSSTYDPTSGMSVDEFRALSISELRELTLNIEGYELDRAILSSNANLYYVFIFIVVLAITVDFSAGSVKNTLSSAISRKKYFFSKTAMVFLVCLLLFFCNTYIAYFANRIVNGGKVSSDLWTVTKISLIQLPPMLAIMGILVGIAFIVKKTSIFNVIAIPLLMVFQCLLSVACMIFRLDSKIVQYELQIMIKNLAGSPSSGYLTRCCLYCGVLIVVFLALGYASFRKSEVK